MNTPKSQNPEGKVVIQTCVQHGNSWIAMHTGERRIVLTVPVEMASAIQSLTTTHADMQRRLKELAAVWEKDWPGDKSPNHAAMRTAAAHCANELRLLLRGDGGHDSDCAAHNEPAMSNGPCDCSAADTRRLEVLDAMLRTCDPEDLPYFQGGQWRAMIGPKEFGFNTLRDVADALRGDGKGEGDHHG